jgi:hypothetical protein
LQTLQETLSYHCSDTHADARSILACIALPLVVLGVFLTGVAARREIKWCVESVPTFSHPDGDAPIHADSRFRLMVSMLVLMVIGLGYFM